MLIDNFGIISQVEWHMKIKIFSKPKCENYGKKRGQTTPVRRLDAGTT